MDDSHHQFSMLDFYDRFVRLHLEDRSPLSMAKEDIQKECIVLLQLAQLSPKEAGIVRDNFGGTLWLSEDGLGKLNEYIQKEKQEHAVGSIQRQWNEQKEGEKAVDESRLEYLTSYIESISSSYYQVLNANRQSGAVISFHLEKWSYNVGS